MWFVYNSLKRVFTPVPGRIQLVESQQGENRQDVIKALNEAVDKYEEGLVIKSPLSIYQPNVRNGSGWLKIKPEYVDGLTDELDVIILGGYFGSGARGGMVSHFLCGVAAPPSSPGEKPSKFYSFCKVGSGYSINELKELCRQLHPHWRKFDINKPPSIIELPHGYKEKPDVWIEPSKSKIVQIKAAEIVPSDNYKAGQTLRFPRLEKIRDDKSWYECLDLNELERLRSIAKGKLSYQHTSTSYEPAPKKRKRVVTRVEKPLTVAKHFAAADASTVEKKSKIFEGKEFYIVNGPPECGKVQIEKNVMENGGSIVQNPGKETFCVIAHKANVRVQNIIKQATCDVVHAFWLLECLESNKLLPWLPSHMMYMSPKTKDRFALDYDANGDSYTKDLDAESLKQIFERIDEKQNVVKLTKSEIAQVESRYFPNSTLGLFRQYRFYVDRFLEIGDPQTKIPSCTLDIQASELRYYGGQLSDTFDEDVSHVIMSQRDLSRLPLIQQMSRDRPRKAHVVTETWVSECIEAGTILKERNYGP
ncbi:DNA ligase 4 [Paramuricea clavata]|uniref:DNA ligase 4 n=1 Tax=Paramuricea clavata TaxID=317549 RepID=A0A6S7GCV9_PARCT|nr:DNA ligase 4 [Paramuricea clavata]